MSKCIRRTANQTTSKTVPKPPKSVFENWTAENEFPVFEFWGRFGSVFREKTSNIIDICSIRTPLVPLAVQIVAERSTSKTKVEKHWHRVCVINIERRREWARCLTYKTNNQGSGGSQNSLVGWTVGGTNIETSSSCESSLWLFLLTKHRNLVLQPRQHRTPTSDTLIGKGKGSV